MQHTFGLLPAEDENQGMDAPLHVEQSATAATTAETDKQHRMADIASALNICRLTQLSSSPAMSANAAVAARSDSERELELASAPPPSLDNM